MAMQSPFFGKREVEANGQRHIVPSPPRQPHAPAGVHPLDAASPGQSPAPGAVPAAPAVELQPAGGSKLIVGPNIKLKGVEITDCDTLVVEGTVEATMDSRLMQIAESGAFMGSAEIDVAEIHGQFDGTLTVRQKLVIYATGRVTGKIRYGRLVVEEGGQLSGEVGFGALPKPVPVVKPALQAA